MLKLPEIYHGIRLIEYPEVDSTNNVCLQLAKSGESERVCVVAYSQTAGRGRQGRSFYSPASTGVYFSLSYRAGLDVESSLLITPAAACAVASVLEELSGRKMGIKWVNDVYCEGKKVCGILTESRLDFSKNALDYAVIGIGVNLTVPEGGFAGELESKAGAVFDFKPDSELRAQVVLKILDRLEEVLSSIPSRGFLEEYRSRSILTGREVSFQRGGSLICGTVTGIDDRCRLEVMTAGGTISLDSGEVSVKLAGA